MFYVQMLRVRAVLVRCLLTLSLNKDRTIRQRPIKPIPQFLPGRCTVFSDPHDSKDVSEPVYHAPPSQREVNSQELMQGTREIIIRHGTEAYRLSVTRSGKLILRK